MTSADIAPHHPSSKERIGSGLDADVSVIGKLQAEGDGGQPFVRCGLNRAIEIIQEHFASREVVQRAAEEFDKRTDVYDADAMKEAFKAVVGGI